MAIIFIDGFDHWVSADNTYQTAFMEKSDTGDNGGGIGNSNGPQARNNAGERPEAYGKSDGCYNSVFTLNFSGWGGEIYGNAGFYARLNASIWTTYYRFFGFGAANSTKTHVALAIHKDTKALHVVSESGSYGSGSVITEGQFYYFDIRVKIHSTTGYIKVWVDGNLDIDLSDINTAYDANGISNVWYGMPEGEGRSYHDHLYCANTENLEDTTVHKIRTFYPIGDDVVQFTPSTGATNYECVDEDGVNGDTDYCYSSTTGHIDRLTIGEYTKIGAPRALQLSVTARKVGGTTSKIRLGVRIGETNYWGTAQDLLTGYRCFTKTWALNPATNNNWTQAIINDTKALIECNTTDDTIRYTQAVFEVLDDINGTEDQPEQEVEITDSFTLTEAIKLELSVVDSVADDANNLQDAIEVNLGLCSTIIDNLDSWIDVAVPLTARYIHPLTTSVGDELNTLQDSQPVDAILTIFAGENVEIGLEDFLVYLTDELKFDFNTALEFANNLDSWLDEVSILAGIPLQAYDSGQYEWNDSLEVKLDSAISVSDLFILSDEISLTLNAFLISRSITDSLNNWADVITLVYQSRRNLDDYLAFHDAVKLFLTQSKGISDTLTLSDAVALSLFISQNSLGDDLNLAADEVELSLYGALSVDLTDSLNNWSDVVSRGSEQSMTSYIRRYLNDVLR